MLLNIPSMERVIARIKIHNKSYIVLFITSALAAFIGTILANLLIMVLLSK